MWMLCALATALATPQLAAGAKRKRTAATRPPLTRGDVRAVDTSVLERGLTEEGELSTTRVLAEHGHYHADVNSRNFNGTVLGYVTPWWVAGRQHGAPLLCSYGSTHCCPLVSRGLTHGPVCF